MKELFYDLHVHSCLSPCADDDMTPANIAGMAKLKGLGAVALTDHNTAANCPSFFSFAGSLGICPIAGMELTVAEEIHMLCLFPTLRSAMSFDSFLTPYRPNVENIPSIFGRQLICDDKDNVCDEYPGMLATATSLDLDSAVHEVRARGGLICPAHADRDSYGIVAVLGTVPAQYGFSCIEFRNADKGKQLIKSLGISAPHYIFDSDAHTLGDISEPEHKLILDTDSVTAAAVIDYLKSCN